MKISFRLAETLKYYQVKRELLTKVNTIEAMTNLMTVLLPISYWLTELRLLISYVLPMKVKSISIIINMDLEQVCAMSALNFH